MGCKTLQAFDASGPRRQEYVVFPLKTPWRYFGSSPYQHHALPVPEEFFFPNSITARKPDGTFMHSGHYHNCSPVPLVPKYSLKMSLPINLCNLGSLYNT